MASLFSQVLDLIREGDGETLAVIAVLLAVWVGLPVHFLLSSLKLNRRTRLMRCLPTSKARGVFIGLAEVKGAAQQEIPIVSYLAERDCVWYSWTIEEEWRRVETETYRDSKGNVRTRTVVRSGWTEVCSASSTDAFLIQDDTGSVRVLPEGAEIEGTRFFTLTCSPGNDIYYGKGPDYAIPNSTYKRRFVEIGVPIGAQLYIIGPTRTQEDGIHPEFAESDSGDPYLISMRDEEAITARGTLYTYLMPLAGLVILYLPAFADTIPTEPPVYAACIYAAACLIAWSWQWYSGMVDTRNRVSQGIAQVEVQYQRRYDLIHQLVEVVDAYCRHETGMLERSAELRGLVEQGHVAMVAEAYPDLKASDLFSRLHQELVDTEERLALAREYLRTIGNFYNTRLQVFPGGLILRILRFYPFHDYEGC